MEVERGSVLWLSVAEHFNGSHVVIKLKYSRYVKPPSILDHTLELYSFCSRGKTSSSCNLFISDCGE